MKQKEYKDAIVLYIEPKDDHYCGECSWLDVGECSDSRQQPRCDLFDYILNYDDCVTTCDSCGGETRSKDYLRLDECKEAHHLVREE